MALERFVVEGGRRLEGTIRPGGNKNAALPILAACLLTDAPVTLRNLPDIQDVLGRAEREFAGGNYAGSSEDLRLATVLLDQATRAPGPKK